MARNKAKTGRDPFSSILAAMALILAAALVLIQSLLADPAVRQRMSLADAFEGVRLEEAFHPASRGLPPLPGLW